MRFAQSEICSSMWIANNSCKCCLFSQHCQHGPDVTSRRGMIIVDATALMPLTIVNATATGSEEEENENNSSGRCFASQQHYFDWLKSDVEEFDTEVFVWIVQRQPFDPNVLLLTLLLIEYKLWVFDHFINHDCPFLSKIGCLKMLTLAINLVVRPQCVCVL